MPAYSIRTRSRRSLAPWLAIVALGAIAACGGGEADAAPDAPTVRTLGGSDVAVAQELTLSSGVTLTGSLTPYEEVQLRAQVPGVLTNVTADRGDAVSRGQVLARIDAEGIRSQASGARAQVAAAEANRALAERQLASARKLYEAGAMSEIDFRSAAAQAEAATAQVTAARAAATGAAEQAGRTAIRAPIGGEISERFVSEGEAVTVGQELFTVVNSRFLELEGQVPVDQAARVREGQAVEFTVGAAGDRPLRGTVSRVDPVADPATRQVGVAMRLPNADRALLGGLFATGRVLTGAERLTVAIPTTAVRGSDGAPYVLVVQGDTIARRPVTVGVRDEARDLVGITAGVSAGDRVIVAPGEVATGMRVRIADAAPTAAAPQPEGR